MGKKISNRSAFTLIELIVVIAIISVLAAVVAPNAFRAVEKAKLARVAADAEAIKTAALAMHADTGLWPGSNWVEGGGVDLLDGAAPGEGFVTKGANPNMPASWDGPYLEKWQSNPWGGLYRWDFNFADQNGDGIGQEHVLWIDNTAGQRIPLTSRIKLDQRLDDGNLHAGAVQVWQGDDTNGNMGYILIQGE